MHSVWWFPAPHTLAFAVIVTSYDWIVDRTPTSQQLVPSPIQAHGTLLHHVWTERRAAIRL